MLRSILINYKTWFLYILLSYIICDYQWLTAIVCFLYSYFACYLGHRLMHTDVFYCNMYSIAHCHHHRSSDDIFAHITNCLTEFLTLANNIVLKYIWEGFQLSSLFFIDKWMILFLYFIYTTVHNINYGMLMVNNYHFYHHLKPETNIGPDFYDILFGTKNIDTPNNENIDHYIPNILFGFAGVMLLKTTYTNYPRLQSDMQYGFFLLWVGLTLVVFFSSVAAIGKEIQITLQSDLEKFTK